MRNVERDIVKHALKLEADARQAAFNTLVQAGHATVMCDERPDTIRVRVDEEFFTDSREAFPSTVLMAKLQLAIAAGQSDRNCVWAQTTPMGWHDELIDYKVLRTTTKSQLMGDILHGPVTATVKRKQKGLRP